MTTLVFYPPKQRWMPVKAVRIIKKTEADERLYALPPEQFAKEISHIIMEQITKDIKKELEAQPKQQESPEAT